MACSILLLVIFKIIIIVVIIHWCRRRKALFLGCRLLLLLVRIPALARPFPLLPNAQNFAFSKSPVDLKHCLMTAL